LLIRYLMLRLQKAKELLAVNVQSITDIAAETGFEDIYHFNKMFRKYEKCSPTAYRNRASML